jgi:hypothetical protein
LPLGCESIYHLLPPLAIFFASIPRPKPGRARQRLCRDQKARICPISERFLGHISLNLLRRSDWFRWRNAPIRLAAAWDGESGRRGCASRCRAGQEGHCYQRARAMDGPHEEIEECTRKVHKTFIQKIGVRAKRRGFCPCVISLRTGEGVRWRSQLGRVPIRRIFAILNRER